MSETIICQRCGEPTPRRSYGTRRCLPCQELYDNARVGNLLTTKPPPIVTQITAEPATEVAIVADLTAKNGYDSKLEARYAEQLIADKATGRIAGWRSKPIKFRLADRTYYTPDFMVTLLDGRLEFHEVKGSWKAAHQEDARVKLKVVAEQFKEFRFVGITKSEAGEWEREEF